MARIKTEVSPKPRAMLNTTINSEVLAEFKAYCKELGIPMNLLIEVFMKQAISGEFILKFGKNNNIEVDLVEDKET